MPLVNYAAEGACSGSLVCSSDVETHELNVDDVSVSIDVSVGRNNRKMCLNRAIMASLFALATLLAMFVYDIYLDRGGASGHAQKVGPHVRASHRLRRHGCVDLPCTDSNSSTCVDYLQREACREDGSYGRGWHSSLGVFSDYATVDGLDARQACCCCGGGESEASSERQLSTQSAIAGGLTVQQEAVVAQQQAHDAELDDEDDNENRTIREAGVRLKLDFPENLRSAEALTLIRRDRAQQRDPEAVAARGPIVVGQVPRLVQRAGLREGAFASLVGRESDGLLDNDQDIKVSFDEDIKVSFDEGDVFDEMPPRSSPKPLVPAVPVWST